MQDVLSRLFSRQSLCRSFACLVLDPEGHQTHRWCRNPRRDAIDHVLRKARPRTGPWLCFTPNLSRTLPQVYVYPRLKHSKRIWIMNSTRAFQVIKNRQLTQDFLSFLQSWYRIESVVSFRATFGDHLQIFVYRGCTCRNRLNLPSCALRLPGLTSLSSATPSIQLLQPSNHICAHHSCSVYEPVNTGALQNMVICLAPSEAAPPPSCAMDRQLCSWKGEGSTPHTLCSIVNRGRTTSCPE